MVIVFWLHSAATLLKRIQGSPDVFWYIFKIPLMFVILFKITNKLVFRLKEVIYYMIIVFYTSIHFSGVIAHADSYIVKFRENVFFFHVPYRGAG